ncbi:BLUF domain-containing protein [Methylobacterium fujisawaense]
MLYISQKLATPDEITDIVEISRARNAVLDVTGALVALQHWFAQILEGSGGSIDTLMTSISRDRRHRDVQILVYEDIKERQFPDWTLAYNGSAHFVDGLIEVLAVRTGATLVPYHLHRLIQGIAEFTRRLH